MKNKTVHERAFLWVARAYRTNVAMLGLGSEDACFEGYLAGYRAAQRDASKAKATKNARKR